MVAKLFTKPFGVAGDKTPIPNDTQVDGTVSYQTGFGADYERQLGVDPAAKNIGRQTFNELMFDTTTALQEMQAGFGTSVYSLSLAQALPGGGYPKGALIPRLAGDGFWLCTVAANTSNPDTGGAGWVQIAAQGSFYAVDIGVANAYSCAFSPALIARSEVQPLAVRIKFTNTGASTINDGLGTVPLVGLAQAPLQGGEVAANGVALLQWVAAIASYVVVYATGGRIQAASATKSLHAVNASQIQSQSVVGFSTAGSSTALTLTPVPAITAYSVPQRFNVTFHVGSGVNPTINISGVGAVALKQYDATGAKVAAVFVANQISDIVYDGVDAVLLDPLPSTTVQRRQNIRGAAINWKASANGISANIVCSADSVVLANTAGDPTVVDSIALTLNTAVAASATVDGMASGAIAANTWYGIYVWVNSSNGVKRITGDSAYTAGLAPTPPAAGFDLWARRSAFRTDGAGIPLKYFQTPEDDYIWQVGPGSNLATPRLMTSGNAGNPNANSWVAVPVAAFVGPTASKIKCFAATSNSGIMVVAPNNAYSSNNSPNTDTGSPISIGGQATAFLVSQTFEFSLESANIYWASASGVPRLWCMGWSEKI